MTTSVSVALLQLALAHGLLIFDSRGSIPSMALNAFCGAVCVSVAVTL